MPAIQTGRVFFDQVDEALSYYPDTNLDVLVKTGQQLYTRVNNFSGTSIPKGSVVQILSASGGLPNVTLAIATHSGNNQALGLAADLIPNGGVGLVLNKGILRGIAINTFAVNDLLYLSSTIPGGYATSVPFTPGIPSPRINQIGWVLATGSTTGEIYVDIVNEPTNLSLTNIDRNILEGNVISTGVYSFSGLVRTSNTTFDVGTASGWVVRNTYTYSTVPDVINVYHPASIGLTTPYLNSDSSTYVLLSPTGSVILQPIFPTPEQRRDSIYLGKIVHPDKTNILNVNNTVDFDVSPMSALRDLWTPLKLINQGVVINTNGANLTFQMNGGTLWGNGINWVNDEKNPDSVAIAGAIPVTFQYRTQTGTQSGFTNRTTIDPDNYDIGGVATAISGAKYTNQRVYLFPTGLVRVQYGQQFYTTLPKAITGVLAESFIEYVNNRDNGILIGIISLKAGTTDLTNLNDCQFTAVSKFGELLGGAAGGVSTTNLQGAYDNSSSNPEILTNATLGAVNIRRGSALDTDNVLTIQNGTGTDTLKVRADGQLTLNGPIVLNTSSTSGLAIGTTTVVSFNASAGNGSYFDYHLSGYSNERRTGTIMTTWNGTSVAFTDTSTPDLNGSTRGIEFNVAIISGNVTLQSVVTSGTWSVDTGIRII